MTKGGGEICVCGVKGEGFMRGGGDLKGVFMTKGSGRGESSVVQRA